MPQFHRRSLESLKKEAKRWLHELDAGDPAAFARLAQALSHATPPAPSLRDVQHALAREQGFSGWAALKADVDAPREAPGITVAQYDVMVDALLGAYRTGTPEAMERHYRHTWHRRPWSGMRTYVQLDLGRRPVGPDDPVDITLEDARFLVAIEHGFASWGDLAAYLSNAPGTPIAARPVRAFASPVDGPGGPRSAVASREWNVILEYLAAQQQSGLEAHGQMTDALLDRVTRIDSVTSLNLEGSKAVTDDGVQHLARLSGLRHLDLSGTAITDHGLEVLRDLSSLETLSLSGTRVTDGGMDALRACPQLTRVNLMWTRTGDGALKALAGNAALRTLRSGQGVTDAGLAYLHDIPAFKCWQGGEITMGLTSYDATPNYLLLRGPFSDRGMDQLRGLDGLFALNLDAGELRLSAAAMVPLVDLPHLGWLAVDARDDWMPHIARMARLQFLGCQDTSAGDEGFVALGRSRSIEYIWGRRCHGLQRRGFLALSAMPTLRGLSVSCLNVDDSGIAALPSFPALRELMPMDVPDAGYRHIGACQALESLVLMYCRDTGDAATAHLVDLPNLTSYFASYTLATDRTPELLAQIASLEEVTLDGCAGVTNAGVAALARLPKLRVVRAVGQGITAEVAAAFGPGLTICVGG